MSYCDCFLGGSKQVPKGPLLCHAVHNLFASVINSIWDMGGMRRGKSGGLIEFDLYSHLWDKRTSKESAHLVASSVDSLLKERKRQITDNPRLLVPSRAA